MPRDRLWDGPRRRCRVLHLVSTFAVKTDTKWLLQIARHLDRSAFELTVACFHGGGPIREQLELCGIPTHDLNTPAEWDLRAVARARRLIGRGAYDVVHTHLLRADLYGGLAARWDGVPVVVSTVYAVGEYRRAVRRRWDGLLDAAHARIPTHFLAVSEAVKRDLVERQGVNKRRVTVIHTGIDPPASISEETLMSALRADMPPHAPNAALIVTAARLSYEKGVDVLIEAAAMLRQTHPTARVVVIGEGPERAALQTRIDALGLTETVRLAGFVGDVWPALRAADVVCLPSKSEGFPNVLLEAMAVGRPVVATAVGGVPEAVTSEQNGLLIPPNDPSALAMAIARLIDRPDEARRLGDAGRTTVERRFLARDVVARYAALYERLTASGGMERGVACATG